MCVFIKASFREVLTKKEELWDNDLWIIRYLSEKRRNWCGECVSENHW